MTEHQEQVEPATADEWESIQVVNRPKWPVVIGIVSLGWAIFGIGCGGLGLAFRVLMPGLVEESLNGDPMPDGLVMGPIDYVIAAISMLLAVVLIFAAIAALSRRPVTRVMHLVYAGVTIPLVIWAYIEGIADQDSINAWLQEYPNNDLAQEMQGQQATNQVVGLVMVIVSGFLMPLFYLIWFGLIKTKAEQVTGGDEGVY